MRKGGFGHHACPGRATACQPNVNGPVRLLNRCPEMPANASALLQESLQKSRIIAMSRRDGHQALPAANVITTAGIVMTIVAAAAASMRLGWIAA
jgi:hypothetical protein